MDEAFEEVLLRALARDPTHRYQSARDFGDALAGYLYNRQLKVTSYDLANLVQSCTGDTVHTKTASGDEHSLIDRLIQEELDQSVDIEDDATTTTERSDSHVIAEAGGVDLEDPSSWFDDDNDIMGGGRSAPPAVASQKESGSWRESGLSATEPNAAAAEAAAEEPEVDVDVDVDLGEGTPVISLQVHSTAPPADELEEADPEPAPESKGGGGKYVLFAILAVGAAALAWYGSQIM